MKKTPKLSPLKDKPLRNPGQSLDEKFDDLSYDHILAPLMIAAFLVVMAGVEWLRYYFPQKPTPLLYSAIAILGIGYAALRV